MKNKITGLLLCFAISIGFIYALYLYSDYINRRPGSFTRFIDPHFWSKYRELDLKFNSYYLAGIDDKFIFLGNHVAPFLVVKVNYHLDTQQLKIKLSDTLIFRAPELLVHKSIFYFFDGSIQRIIVGNSYNFIGTSIYQTQFRFNDFMPLHDSDFVLRMMDDSLQQNILAKQTTAGFLKIKYAPEKQQDGFFSIDGRMDFDPYGNTIVYTFYYRNQFLVLDTNLNMLNKFNTIDTNSIAKIKVTPIYADNITTLGEPPLIINQKTCVFRGQLYILSAQQAKNQSRLEFENNSTVDIYTLITGKYLKSFYLPNVGDGVKVKSFNITDSSMVALYDHKLVIFDLNRIHG
jgi:hypothetical protein